MPTSLLAPCAAAWPNRSVEDGPVTVPQSAAGTPSGGTASLAEPGLVSAGGWPPDGELFAVRFLPMCGIDNGSNGQPHDAPMDTSEDPP